MTIEESFIILPMYCCPVLIFWNQALKLPPTPCKNEHQTDRTQSPRPVVFAALDLSLLSHLKERAKVLSSCVSSSASGGQYVRSHRIHPLFRQPQTDSKQLLRDIVLVFL
jgi:hypothetical protein